MLELNNKIVKHEDLVCTTSQEFYDVLSGILEGSDGFTKADSLTLKLLTDAMEDYMYLRGRILELREKMDESDNKNDGISYETSNQHQDIVYKEHPYFKALDLLDKKIKSYLRELGMSPAARARMNIDNANAALEKLQELFPKIS